MADDASVKLSSARSMGHIALHYGEPENGPKAAKLLSLLGFVETQSFPIPQGGLFYRFVVDPKHQARGDGIVFLSSTPPAQRNLYAAIKSALKVGTPDEHPAVAEMRAGCDADPEFTFHVGVLMESLEDLEAVITNLQKLEKTDPDLKGRLTFTFNRALAGDGAVDARLDASPVYGDVKRYAYGRGGVQAFVETDLLSSGPLGQSLVIELDYVFPDRDLHILSTTEV